MRPATETREIVAAGIAAVRADLAARFAATFPTVDDRRRFALDLLHRLSTDENGDLGTSVDCEFVDLVYWTRDTDHPGTSDPFDDLPIDVHVEITYVPFYDGNGDAFIRVTLEWTGAPVSPLWDRTVDVFDSGIDNEAGFVAWIESLATGEVDR